MHLVLPGESCLDSTCQAQQWHSQLLILILALQLCQLIAQLDCLLTMASHASNIRHNMRVQGVCLVAMFEGKPGNKTRPTCAFAHHM
jgi:hypothetical protein